MHTYTHIYTHIRRKNVEHTWIYVGIRGGICVYGDTHLRKEGREEGGRRRRREEGNVAVAWVL